MSLSERMSAATTEIQLVLSEEQARHLAACCTRYRLCVWQRVPASPERNRTLRMVQEVQGRLLMPSVEGHGPQRLMVSQSEQQALRQMAGLLVQQALAQPASEQRRRTLEALAELHVLLLTKRQRAAVEPVVEGSHG